MKTTLLAPTARQHEGIESRPLQYQISYANSMPPFISTRVPLKYCGVLSSDIAATTNGREKTNGWMPPASRTSSEIRGDWLVRQTSNSVACEEGHCVQSVRSFPTDFSSLPSLGSRNGSGRPFYPRVKSGLWAELMLPGR
ncbi:hypothetical protein TNCV_1494451 [Trichonephila clavipes]|nr:hypothetical protein TNCV_1494451 [Trichonephila clavipes]